MTDADMMRISQLVMPPGLVDAAGHDAMTTASGRGTADNPADILTAVGKHAKTGPVRTFPPTGTGVVMPLRSAGRPVR
ncbi:hypothetical protein [Umezawaea sp. Da 62-37]|uniref:hypothetical protein n=1 Tax=Umezawaea sp. Da 62-37 TaxID=3075927 RepID=UPI0028F70DD3|nr:hypothetical protein [Umezawaea sp. Da 62-37]WNV87477.1 hypothetical protein RM788_04010 [Umezawaea sp. Da 62-37]